MRQLFSSIPGQVLDFIVVSEGLALRGSEVVLAGQGHRNNVCRRLEAD